MNTCFPLFSARNGFLKFPVLIFSCFVLLLSVLCSVCARWLDVPFFLSLNFSFANRCGWPPYAYTPILIKMHALITRPFNYLLLALFAFQIAAAVVGSPNEDSLRLAPRQGAVPCDEYATLANLSTIAMNSTFRAAFIQASRDGTLKSSAILDTAMMQFMSLNLVNDTATNQECGNLTAVAATEAPKNFTLGVVGPFQVPAS
jgi:hypothetical protein